jgi:nucleoid-associated protein YgaU
MYGLFAADASDSDLAAPVIPAAIRNNRYYLESLRLTKLAQDVYDSGDYDASSEYAAEAIKYAQLSDEYVALQLKIKAANDAIKAAHSRLDWAVTVKAPARYPDEFTQARASYDLAIKERSAQRWDEAIEAANQVIIALANVQAPPSEDPLVAVTVPPAPPPIEEKPVLPAQYTVLPWSDSRDCLWNIAERPWAYGDSGQWKFIYEANRSRLPDPSNPHLILPGMILDIPSIQGEVRQGMWDPSKNYDPLR